MRRVVIAIALCLLLGLLTSIALAWAAALEFGDDYYGGVKGQFNSDWVGTIVHDLFVWEVALRRVVEEDRRRDIKPQPYDVPAPFADLIEPPYSDDYVRAKALMSGVPYPCLYYTRRLDTPYVFIEQWDYTNHGALRGFNPFEDSSNPEADAMLLPLRPHWPGLLANITVLGAAFFLLPTFGYGVRTFRAALRRRQNRCEFCKYTLYDDAARCSECGRLRRTRQPLVSRRANAGLAVLAFIAAAAISGYAVTFTAHDPVEPIIRASYKGDADRVRELLADGADPEFVKDVPIDSEYWYLDFMMTPVMAAAVGGDVKIMELLLDAGADPNVTVNGMAVLSVAADAMHFEVCEVLIARGADPNLRISRSLSLLELPVISGNREAVRYLIDKGANPSNGDTSIISAFVRRDGPMIDLLVEHGADLEAGLFAAVRFGDRKRFEQYLECGADPLQIRETGNTLLFATDDRCYDQSIYEYLIDADVDVNARSASGDTALMSAAYDGNWRMVQFLLDHGADPDAVNQSGETTLSLAMETLAMNMPEARLCVLLLLVHHADPTGVTDNMLSPHDQQTRSMIQSAQASWREFEATNKVD